MRKLLNTLFITSENAYLSLEGETVCVEINRQKAGQLVLCQDLVQVKMFFL